MWTCVEWGGEQLYVVGVPISNFHSDQLGALSDPQCDVGGVLCVLSEGKRLNNKTNRGTVRYSSDTQEVCMSVISLCMFGCTTWNAVLMGNTIRQSTSYSTFHWRDSLNHGWVNIRAVINKRSISRHLYLLILWLLHFILSIRLYTLCILLMCAMQMP